MLSALLLAGGCSGINASHSVSPASFFLPGLLQADPPAATADDLRVPAAATGFPLAQVQ